MLAPWVEPPAEFQQRDWVLAGLIAGSKQGMRSIGDDALRRFNTISGAQVAEDAALLAGACDAMLDHATARATVDLCRQAAEMQPRSADRALALGRALARSGDASGAERQFNSAIRLDPSFKRAYMELWTLYDGQHRISEMRETAARYLKWNPRNILFRRLNAIIATEGPPN